MNMAKTVKWCPTSISPDTQNMCQNKFCDTNSRPQQSGHTSFKRKLDKKCQTCKVWNYCWGPWPGPCPWMQTASLATCLGGFDKGRTSLGRTWFKVTFLKASTALNGVNLALMKLLRSKRISRRRIGQLQSNPVAKAEVTAMPTKATLFTARVFKWPRKHLKCDNFE